jgi:hypothetical protein
MGMMRLAQIMAPPVFGGSTSCLPEVTALLEDRSYYKALKLIKRPSDEERYHSVEDWLLCSTLPHFKRPCFKYYEDEGPNFLGMTTEAERKFIQRMILCAMERARRAHMFAESLTWKGLRKQVALAIAADQV